MLAPGPFPFFKIVEEKTLRTSRLTTDKRDCTLDQFGEKINLFKFSVREGAGVFKNKESFSTLLIVLLTTHVANV